MVFSDCLPGTQREAPHSKIILFHVLGKCMRTSASLKCEKSFNKDLEFPSYHPFIPKSLERRTVAMKLQGNWAIL